MKALAASIASLGMSLAGDVKVPFVFTANSSDTYNATTGLTTTVGTTITVMGLYYQIETSRPVLRPIEGVTPEPPAITTPTGLFKTVDLMGIPLKIDDPVSVNGEPHRITDIKVDPAYASTIIMMQRQ